jgi:glycosyltransferase involved in cell wall biosynthesis
MITLILTIHNQEEIIKVVLDKAYTNAYAIEKMIILFDGCTDRSKEIVEKYLHMIKDMEVETYELPDVFETKANNFGLKKVTTPYAILLQDDCVISEPEYDVKLLEAIRKYKDVFAVSGRNSHNLMPTPDGLLNYTLVAGAGTRLNNPNKLYIRQVINRGPLILDMEVVRRLNYLDEEFAPLFGDDQDLCLRAFQLGYVCGCRPIQFLSKPEWGGTRKGDTSWVGEAIMKNMKIIVDRHFKPDREIHFFLNEERDL